MISSNDIIMASFLKLKSYCEREQFKGWDPYDGLNSTLFAKIPFLSENRTARLFWIQFFKRSPVNFRSIARVEKGLNPKGLGLFLSGYCNLYYQHPDEATLENINFLAEALLSLRSTGFSGNCWGYNFDWQARAFFQAKNTPTVVATCFIANALIDAYEVTGTGHFLDAAVDSANFIMKDLNRTYNKCGDFCFSYSPKDSTQVFNASLLGSKLLGRIYKYTGNTKLFSAAKSSIRYCCDAQNEDGSWSYGTLPFHQWVDNFHTGFNLEALMSFQQDTGETAFEPYIKKGVAYYLDNFFTKEGAPKYFDDKLYPIDIHCTAQLIITLSKLNKFNEQKVLIDKVLKWTITNMQDKEGFFYYQLRKHFSNKIPYMRWAQAWMFFAMSEYLTCSELGRNSSKIKKLFIEKSNF
ncbi:hypothetical protein SAMN05192529_11457 [Arachidicoccus rhizosphaerae]|uniref:Delta-aminolevulinic acid dehydratase n=1 Tax=Arachidicoccus rhizosphaerae TaxID=551991 RepID=A0A1H4ADN1_9BACT|nr:delta-aminolevulinic acid dehydratase [Arachidicoccus rhizosphaerae]SEA34030.1 hypothetical protein SAMN05192529_11457 [Arachidicoccus rhizosphaerae]